MSEEMTEIFKRGGRAISNHKKTAIGGLGGASIATMIAVVMPYFHDAKVSQTKTWEEISRLKERVAIIETKEQDLRDELNNSK